MAVSAVHRVGSRSKRLSRLTSVRSCSRVLSIHHIGCNGQDGRCGNTSTVGLGGSHIVHKIFHDLVCDLIHTVVIISKFRVIALYLKVYDNTVFVTDGFYLRVFDRGKRICDYRKSGDTGGEPSGNVLVVERHLDTLIAVFVMHIVNDVQSVHIYVGQPAAHVVIAVHNLVIIKILGSNGTVLRSHLLLGDLVHAAVDRVKQALRKIGAGAEELHFFSYSHRRYAACDGVIVSMCHSHKVVVLILDRGGRNGSLRTETFEVPGKSGRPEHRQVRLGSRSQVVQCMKITVGHFGHHTSSVDSHTADGFRYPGGVSGKQGVVLRRSCELHKTELHDEMVDKLLNLFFCKRSVLQVSFRINIKEGRGTSKGHRRSVLFLDRREITEIQPLDRLLHVCRRSGDIKSVDSSQLLQFFQGLDLFGKLLSVTDHVLIHVASCSGFLIFFVFDQLIHAIKGNPSVIADDTSAAIGVRKSGDDMAGTAGAHLR